MVRVSVVVEGDGVKVKFCESEVVDKCRMLVKDVI